MGTNNRTVFGCPSCGARVSGYELACPRCGAVFTKGTKFECPFCGVMVPRDSAKCPSCGIELRIPEEKSVEASLDELFDQVIHAEKQKAHAGDKRFGCPKCSFLLTGTEDRCPNCSYAFTKVNQVECPICGALIPSTAKKCPECDRALLSLNELASLVRDEPEEPPPAPSAEEALFPELEEDAKAPEPVTAPVTIIPPPPDSEEGGLAICPVCGKASPMQATSCPHCKTEFEPAGDVEQNGSPAGPKHAAEEASLALDALLKTTAKPVQPEKRHLKTTQAATTKVSARADRESAGKLGRVNGTGFVNGRRGGHGGGATNGTGLVNGAGAVNGLGATNGVSLVNGKGASNGLAVNGRVRPGKRSRRDILLQWRFLAVVAAIMMVIPALFIIGVMNPSSEYQIDGDFDEWAHVQSYPAQKVSTSPTINIQGWSAAFLDEDFYYYVRTESDIMSGSLVESIYIFIDSDSSPSTGYSLGAMGADYRVTLEGWNGTVRASTVSEYDLSEDPNDWNSWSPRGSSACTLQGNEIEGSARLGDAASANPKILMVSKDEAENLCFSAPVPLGGTVLIVDQECAPAVESTGIVEPGASVQFLRLTFCAMGGSGTVSTVTPVTVGCEVASSFTPAQIIPGTVLTYDFYVDTSGGSAAQLVSAVVAEECIESSFDGVLVCGAGARAYLTEPPANVTIDGAFADWLGRTSQDSDLIPVRSANIDIQETGASNTTESAFFFISVKGEMCCGAYVPSVCAKPVQGGGGTLIPVRKTAEDFTRVYIDTDMLSSTGLSVSYLSKSIGADRMIEVRGLFGRISSAAMFAYGANGWSETTAYIDAANDEQRLELEVALSALGSPDAIDFMFETTCWNGKSDLAVFDPDAASAYAMSGELLSTRAWPVDTSVTPTTATAMSYQRKLFYDGTNFWSFYFDGTDTVHKYSTDGGQTWTDEGAVFSTSDVRSVSIWYDSSNNIVYAVGDTASASRNVYVQRGSVNPGSHTITWAASDSTCSISTNTHASKLAFISKDASGYIWVAGTNKTTNSPAKWDMTAFKSLSTDSISSWSATGNMLDSDRTDDYLYATILPTGSGSNMWLVYNYDMRVAARQYSSGSWSAETIVYNGAGGAANFIQVAPAGAVVDANGVIHVIYGDSTKDASSNSLPNIYYTYYTGSAWSAPLALDGVADSVGNKCPAISLDTSTGNLYAFWIQMNNDNVICKRNVSGTWGFVEIGGQTSYAKSYLTSVYSAPGPSYICFMWTQNTSSPIEVMFDRIPELGDALIPVCFMVLAIFLFARRRARNALRN